MPGVCGLQLCWVVVKGCKGRHRLGSPSGPANKWVYQV